MHTQNCIGSKDCQDREVQQLTHNCTQAIFNSLSCKGGGWSYLEGAAVLGGHDVAHFLHHVAEALHLFRAAKTLHKRQQQK